MSNKFHRLSSLSFSFLFASLTVQVCLFHVQDFPALATSHGQQLVPRLSRGVQIAGSSSQDSPKPLQALASDQRRKHCSKTEGASAPPTAAASWSRTRRRRRGSNHFAGRRPPDAGTGTEREKLWRSLQARSAAGLWVQACLGFARSSWPLSVSLFPPSVRPPEKENQLRSTCSFLASVTESMVVPFTKMEKN